MNKLQTDGWDCLSEQVLTSKALSKLVNMSLGYSGSVETILHEFYPSNKAGIVKIVNSCLSHIFIPL